MKLFNSRPLYLSLLTLIVLPTHHLHGEEPTESSYSMKSMLKWTQTQVRELWSPLEDAVSQTFENFTNGSLILDNTTGGSITVKALSEPGVQSAYVTHVKQGGSTDTLNELTSDATLVGNTLTVKPQKKGSKGSICYTILVPEGTHVQLTTHGKGTLTVKKLGGNAWLSSEQGAITFEDLRGDVVARSQSGTISGSHDTERPARLSLKTESGSINLALPADLNAEIDARAPKGCVESEQAVLRHAIKSAHTKEAWGAYKKNLEGILGDPDVPAAQRSTIKLKSDRARIKLTIRNEETTKAKRANAKRANARGRKRSSAPAA